MTQPLDIIVKGMTLKGQIAATISRRDECSKRGYHLVETEPKGDKDLMICYHCDLWFDKKFARLSDINYRVEPICDN